MNIFKRIKNHSILNNKDWKVLEDEETLNKAISDSYKYPIVLFKHSTSCGISAAAKYRLESDWKELENYYDFYYLDLLSYRNISNTIAEILGVIHQSPQVIVVKNGKAVYSASHASINFQDLSREVKNKFENE